MAAIFSHSTPSGPILRWMSGISCAATTRAIALITIRITRSSTEWSSRYCDPDGGRRVRRADDGRRCQTDVDPRRRLRYRPNARPSHRREPIVTAFADRVATFFDEYLRLDPVAASSIGDHRFDDRWPDMTDAGRAERLAFVDRWSGEDRKST